MAFVDLCRFIPTLGGTTDWVYSSAVGGCQSPTAANVKSGQSYYVYAVSSDQTQWELSIGVNSGITTFPRTIVISNSSVTGAAPGQSGAGTKINFSTVPQVSVVAVAENLIAPDSHRGYLSGLTLSTAGSSATFTVAAGTAIDSGNTDILTLTASISKTTGAWAVGSGNGALDTGVIANATWYHAYLIKRIDTQIIDVLVSLSASSPTMPSGYTVSRRVGSMLTDGSAKWVAFSQLGDEFLWKSPVNVINGAAPTAATLISLAGGCPTGIQALAKIRGFGAGSAANGLLFQSPDETSAIGNATAGNLDIIWGAGSQSGANFTVRTDTSANVRWSAATTTATAQVAVFGWIDRRGRDS